MFRAAGFVLIQALFLLSVASPACLAGEQNTQQVTPPPPAEKPHAKSRSLRMNELPSGASAPERSPSAPPPSSPRPDGGRPDDTVGGLPGHSAGAPAN